MGTLRSEQEAASVPTHQTLNRVVTDARSWSADTVDAAASWYTPLPEACLAELDDLVRERQAAGGTTDLRVAAGDLVACREALQTARADLDAGRGFVIIDRLPLERYTPDEARTRYWLLGQLLGRPFEQDIVGTLLFDVRDSGQDVAKAPASPAPAPRVRSTPTAPSTPTCPTRWPCCACRWPALAARAN